MVSAHTLIVAGNNNLRRTLEAYDMELNSSAISNSRDAYRGTEGTRPYAGAGWYYAQYRKRVSTEFMAQLAERLGWYGADRILDLGAGSGQLALLCAPIVAEVIAVEPEIDMAAEGEKRAHDQGVDNVRFIIASSKDLPALRESLGRFRTVLM